MEAKKGPWRFYILENGIPGMGMWFSHPPIQFDGELTAERATNILSDAVRNKKEVKILDRDDNLIYHSRNGENQWGWCKIVGGAPQPPRLKQPRYFWLWPEFLRQRWFRKHEGVKA